MNCSGLGGAGGRGHGALGRVGLVGHRRVAALVRETTIGRGTEGTLRRCIRRRVIYIIVGYRKSGHGQQGERGDVLHLVQGYFVDFFVGR